MSTAFGTRRILHGLATSGALLTCFAIVLSLGPFAQAPKREPVRALTEQPVELTSISMPTMDAGIRPEQAVVIGPSQASETLEAQASFEPSPPSDLAGAPEPAAVPDSSIVGVWVPDASACSVRAFREGLLPTVINLEGAWAGETFCIFKKRSQTEAGWTVTADCSNSRERWTAHVRLAINGNRLIWSSKRGTQAYTRCAADFLMAEAR
jgi:hypothetical protein